MVVQQNLTLCVEVRLLYSQPASQGRLAFYEAAGRKALASSEHKPVLYIDRDKVVC